MLGRLRIHAYMGLCLWQSCRWPDNWSNTALPWVIDWIEAHAAHAVILGKPLILQEWGVHVGAAPCKPLRCLCYSQASEAALRSHLQERRALSTWQWSCCIVCSRAVAEPG